MTVFSLVEIFPSATSSLLILFSLTLFTLYYFQQKNAYWRRRGVPQLAPIPFVGDTMGLTFGLVPPAFEFQRIYDKFRDHKFGGFYRNTRPTIMLRDPELVKAVFLKNFAHFHDRSGVIDEEVDPFSVNLFNLTGERWKNIRTKLVLTFTSAKLRSMQDLMNDCVVEMNKKLTTTIGGGAADVNVCEDIKKYMIDVIGSCAYGIRCNAPGNTNFEFHRIARVSFNSGYRSYIRKFLELIDSRLIRLFNVKNLSAEVEEFFMSVLRETVKHSETSAGRKRNDFLQLLTNLQTEERRQLQSNGHVRENGSNGYVQQNGNGNMVQNGMKEYKEAVDNNSNILLTDNVVASSAFVFFPGGLDGITTALVYCLYELALNPHISDKVRDEIDAVKRAHNGSLDYDAMKKLVYVDMVISESFRKYPTASVTGRRCTEPFRIPGTSVVVEEGVIVDVSVYGLHHDPQYFPNPEKFRPERFSRENRQNITPFTYLPFGNGPRMCPAMRFVHFAMRTALVDIVSNFTVEPCEKTPIPLKFDPKAIALKPLGGVWLRMQRRPKS